MPAFTITMFDDDTIKQLYCTTQLVCYRKQIEKMAAINKTLTQVCKAARLANLFVAVRIYNETVYDERYELVISSDHKNDEVDTNNTLTLNIIDNNILATVMALTEKNFKELREVGKPRCLPNTNWSDDIVF